MLTSSRVTAVSPAPRAIVRRKARTAAIVTAYLVLVACFVLATVDAASAAANFTRIRSRP